MNEEFDNNIKFKQLNSLKLKIIHFINNVMPVLL